MVADKPVSIPFSTAPVYEFASLSPWLGPASPPLSEATFYNEQLGIPYESAVVRQPADRRTEENPEGAQPFIGIDPGDRRWDGIVYESTPMTGPNPFRDMFREAEERAREEREGDPDAKHRKLPV